MHISQKEKIHIEISGSNSEISKVYHNDCCGNVKYNKNELNNIELSCETCGLKLSFNNYMHKMTFWQVVNKNELGIIEYPQAIVYLLPVKEDFASSKATDKISFLKNKKSDGSLELICRHLNCVRGKAFSIITFSSINPSLRFLECRECQKKWLIREEDYTKVWLSDGKVDIHSKYSNLEFNVIRYKC